MEFLVGGRKDGGTVETAINFYKNLKKLPKNKLFGVYHTDNFLGLIKNPVIPIYDLDNKIKILEGLQKEFPNDEGLRIKIITLKELKEEYGDGKTIA